jgi:hypothetical protein
MLTLWMSPQLSILQIGKQNARLMGNCGADGSQWRFHFGPEKFGNGRALWMH